MSTSKPNVKKMSASELRELEVRSFVGRSDAYRYLRKNHAHLVSQKVGTDEGPSWDDIAKILTRRGYVSSRGQRLTGNALRRVFRRVEHDLKRAEPSTNRPAPPSRQRADWQPPVAAPQRKPGPQPAPPPQSRTETQLRAGPAEGAGNADAQMAALRRQFAWMDRHIVQQPDED